MESSPSPENIAPWAVRPVETKRGGNVVFVADGGLSTPMVLSIKHFKAERGAHGRGKNTQFLRDLGLVFLWEL